MKKTLQIALLAIAIFTASCKKDSLSKNSTSNNPVIGEWSISSFADNGIDKTTQFASYLFDFTNNNNLQIKNGTMMMSMCSWTFADSIYHFNMTGMHNDALTDLDDDWKLMNTSDTSCQFIDHNPDHNRTFIMRRN